MARPSPRLLMTPRGLVLSLLLAGLLFSSVYPMRRYFAVRTEIKEMHQKERSLDERVTVLTEEKERLESDDEVERLAREELAMVRPGEVAFVIVTPKPAPKGRAPTVGPGGLEPPSPPEQASFLRRWWSAVARAARIVR